MEVVLPYFCLTVAGTEGGVNLLNPLAYSHKDTNYLVNGEYLVLCLKLALLHQVLLYISEGTKHNDLKFQSKRNHT